MADSFDSEGQPTAAFNSARAYTEELSLLRRRLHIARIENNITDMYNLLRSYFIALSPRMKTKPDKKETKSMIQKSQDKYKEATTLYHEYTEAMRTGQLKISAKIYDVFGEWEMMLRKDENTLKLLMRDSDDPGLALG